MEQNKIFAKLEEIFREVFDDDAIKLSEATCADDIEDWDSLTHITLISEIEEAFEMKFSMKEVTGMKNVGEMADIISKKCS